ncbi:MAG: Rid family detoxifying hydrolase [Gammaproteobacteria bacterium]|nr:Rid family detoxifying hydrolase [Gammaproteobacteria bacterium]
MNKRKVLLAATAIVVCAATPALADESVSPDHLNSHEVFPSGLPFSEAVRVGNTLYLAGQIGIVPGTMKLVPGGLEAETRQTLENIKTSLEAHGYSMDDLVKCTIMLADISRWADFNDIYKTWFDERFPARSAFGANGLALGAQVEIDCVAAGQPGQ